MVSSLELHRVSEVAMGAPGVLLWDRAGWRSHPAIQIWLGYGQQICFPGITKQCKTGGGSVEPWVVWSQSSGWPWLGCRGWWRSPLLLSPFLNSMPPCASFTPGTTAAQLSSLSWVLGDLIHYH